MNNYKIKVNDEAESREAQELFFELGFKWGSYHQNISYLDKKYIYTIAPCGLFYGDSRESYNTDKSEEITLQQLRDIVVLKRNKIEDATHEDKNDPEFKYRLINNHWYVITKGNPTWRKDSIDLNEAPFFMKPISEQKMASHNIEQQELKANPKLFLDPTQNYAEIEWDGSFMKQDHWIEVPDGAEIATKGDLTKVWFWKNQGNNIFFSGAGKWSKKCDEPLSRYLERVGKDVGIVWQRTQDEPFLTPESVVEREVNSKNVVQKANEFSERLNTLEREVKRLASNEKLEQFFNQDVSDHQIDAASFFASAAGSIKPQDAAQQGAIKSDGGSTDYYKKEIPALVLDRWKKTGIIEAEDVIRLFLGNDFTQGNNFKAGVRLISAQQGKGKAGLDPMYDHNKQEWFAASAKQAFIEFD